MPSNPGGAVATPPPPTVLLTRPRDRAAAFAASLPPGTNVIMAPLMRIEPLAHVLPVQVDALIFTSAHAPALMSGGGLPAGLVAWCVGAETVKAAKRAGFDARDGGRTVADFIAMANRLEDAGHLVYGRGRHQSADLAADLRSLGHVVAEVVLYDQVATGFDAEAARAISAAERLVMPVFSRRSARILADALRGLPRCPHATVVALAGWADTRSLFNELADVEVCSEPTGPAMVAAVAAHLAAPRLGL